MSVAIISLTLLGSACEVEASELPPAVSPLTGEPIRRLAVTLVAQSEEENERLTSELVAAERTGTIHGIAGEQWRVARRDYEVRPWAGGTRYIHSVELCEREELQIEAVEFGALALAPERWKLDEGAGPATFRFLATLDADQHQHFQQFHGQAVHGQTGDSYFPVTWGGVTQPVSLRFGQCLWESADDGGARHLITLVTQEDGTQQTGVNTLFNFDPLFDPWKPRLIEQAIRIRSGFDALLSEMEQAGVLGGEAIGRIKDSVSNPAVSGIREFDRVYRIEDYFE